MKGIVTWQGMKLVPTRQRQNCQSGAPTLVANSGDRRNTRPHHLLFLGPQPRAQQYAFAIHYELCFANGRMTNFIKLQANLSPSPANKHCSPMLWHICKNLKPRRQYILYTSSDWGCFSAFECYLSDPPTSSASQSGSRVVF